MNLDEETTVATPLTDMLKIMIMQRRSDAIESIEEYNKTAFQNINTSNQLPKVRATVYSLFIELRSAMKRDTKKDFKFSTIETGVKSKEAEKVIAAFYEMDEWLDNKKIIRVDVKTTYDSSRAEVENKYKKV